MRASPPRHRIELRLRELDQLFNSMDPTPFRHKDLDPEAEQFIESWALEFPPDSRFHLTVHLEQPPRIAEPEALVTEALHNYFEYKAQIARREFRILLHQGRMSLLIGLGVLGLALVASEALAKLALGRFLDVLRESLTIGGWVAMWRPMQIFLYDWWPLRRRQRIYRNLARAQVTVERARGAGGAASA